MKMKNTSITEHNSMEIAQWMVKGKETDTINGDNGSREGIARLGGATQNIEQVKRIYLKINTYFIFAGLHGLHVERQALIWFCKGGNGGRDGGLSGGAG